MLGNNISNSLGYKQNREKIFSREDIFAGIYFREKIISREDIFAETLYSRKYLPAKISEIHFSRNFHSAKITCYRPYSS